MNFQSISVDVYSHELVFLLFCNVPLYGQTSLYIAFCKSDCVKWFLSAIFLHASPGRQLGVFSHVYALCLLPLWTAQSYALFMFWMRAHFKSFILFSYWFVEVVYLSWLLIICIQNVVFKMGLFLQLEFDVFWIIRLLKYQCLPNLFLYESFLFFKNNFLSLESKGNFLTLLLKN